MRIDHGTRASATLDAVRAVAAFAVLAGHARNLLFVDYGELTAAGAPTRAFYFATGLGHQAVLVFFVLSGFFIGHAIKSRHTPGATWSWGNYLISRVSRLHLVLIPALLLTLLWDHLGASAMPGLYDGSFPGNILPADISAHHGVDTLVLNSLYLQTIAAPTIGSNGALWSLANEFWYYLLFPLALRAVVARRLVERIVSAGLAVAAAVVVGREILLYFPVWLLGATLTVIPIPRIPAWARRLLPWIGGLATLGALALARVRPGLLADYVLAGAVFLWVYGILAAPRAETPARSVSARVSVRLAAFSYSLYALHLPFIVALRAFIGGEPGAPERWAPGPEVFGMYVALLAASLAYAWLIAQGTEARTATVRRALRRVFLERRRPAPVRSG